MSHSIMSLPPSVCDTVLSKLCLLFTCLCLTHKCLTHSADNHPCAVAEGEMQGSTERYNEVDLLVRKMLWWRAFKAHGVAFANAALVVRDTFVQVCCMAQRTDGQAGCPDIHQSAQVGNKLLQANAGKVGQDDNCPTLSMHAPAFKESHKLQMSMKCTSHNVIRWLLATSADHPLHWTSTDPVQGYCIEQTNKD